MGTLPGIVKFIKEVVPYSKEFEMTIVIKSSADKATIQKILGGLVIPKKFDAYKYCGVFQLQATPMEIQKTLRDEWE